MLGWMTGGDRFVVRGGYARTHDYAFLNIALNIVSSFPYVAAINRSNLANAFSAAAVDAGRRARRDRPEPADAHRRRRGLPCARLRPVQPGRRAAARREPRAPRRLRRHVRRTTCSRRSTATRGCRSARSVRIRSRGVIRLRANTAESWYHSLQTQLDKRFSRGLSAGVHYTWSRFEDTASEIFNPSTGEVAVAQDSFDLRGREGRSSYDRPHRLAGNFVWELPVMRERAAGLVGKMLGGWQVSSFFTFQSGAPFTVLNGSDPTGALAGIDGLVGNAIRPNLNTDARPLGHVGRGAARGRAARRCSGRCAGTRAPTCAGERVGNVPRNSLRADGIGNVDIGIVEEHAVRQRPQHPVPHRYVQRDEHAELRDPRRPDQLGELPQPVGHQRRQPPCVGRLALHLLTSRVSGPLEATAGHTGRRASHPLPRVRPRRQLLD